MPAKKKISYLIFVPPVIFFALAALFMTGLGRENPNGLPSTLIGRSAPVLETTPLGDLPQIDDALLRAKNVKIVNFWASWCLPCRVEHPNLITLKNQGIQIYGVNYKDEKVNALKFLSDLGNPFAAIGQDFDGRQAIEWGVYGVPETFIIDGNGKIVLRFPGPITKHVLEKTILPAIQKARENTQ